ncbi:MAG: DUF2218 domain-containing protein [Sphingomonadales bacterium]|nr:DUF2218 domain-containing protein [Sphingomonadales bacterium]
MPRSMAVIATPHASRYLQQLCKHWSHKFAVRFDATCGHVPLPSGTADLAAGDMALTVTCEAPEEALARLQEVVAEHLRRFAFREGELNFDWRRV